MFLQLNSTPTYPLPLSFLSQIHVSLIHVILMPHVSPLAVVVVVVVEVKAVVPVKVAVEAMQLFSVSVSQDLLGMGSFALVSHLMVASCL